jgi:predicted methyltransferase
MLRVPTGAGREATESASYSRACRRRTTVSSRKPTSGTGVEEEALFLRNPEDTYDWNAAPSSAGEQRGTSDRAVLRFVRPRQAGSSINGGG